jgi:histidine triad (HIT) family protein
MSTASSRSAFADRATSGTSCPFCDIVAGRAPASRVFETKETVALVPIHPKSEGHCLVIPKRHVTRMHGLPDPTLMEIVGGLRRLAQAVGGASYDILQVNGPDANDPGVQPRDPIDHVHFHLIPRSAGDGVRIMTPAPAHPSRSELDRMASRIRDALREDA